MLGRHWSGDMGDGAHGGSPPVYLTLPFPSQGLCSCIQTAPDFPPYPLLLSSDGCYIVSAHIRGPLLLSGPTGQDALPDAQLCQWSPPNLSTQPRHV